MGVDIQGKGPQPRGKKGQKALDVRQLPGQGQVEQHRSRRRYKGRGRLRLGGLLSGRGQGCIHLLQGKTGLLDAPQREVGVGIEQTGGQPRSHVGTDEIGLRFQRRPFRLTAEIVVFRQSDVPLGR